MIVTSPLFSTWLLFLAVAGPIEEAHQQRLIEASRAVCVGMTPVDVRDILGEPDGEYGPRGLVARLLMGPRPKQWMYGSRLNLNYLIVPGLPFPNPLPINIRIAGYAAEDLIIDWSLDDTVTAIRRPEVNAPRVAHDLLESVNFAHTALRTFVFTSQ